MTTPPPGSREAARPEWLIKKRGYFYRADKAGYTAKVDEAGLYTEADAKAEARIEPEVMSAHHISEFPTLRAALAPPADVAGKVEEIRARHKHTEPREGFSVSLRDGQQAHADRATLLRLLSEERARRVEVEGALIELNTAIDKMWNDTEGRVVNERHALDITHAQRAAAATLTKDTQDE